MADRWDCFEEADAERVVAALRELMAEPPPRRQAELDRLEEWERRGLGQAVRRGWRPPTFARRVGRTHIETDAGACYLTEAQRRAGVRAMAFDL